MSGFHNIPTDEALRRILRVMERNQSGPRIGDLAKAARQVASNERTPAGWWLPVRTGDDAPRRSTTTKRVPI